MSTDFPVHVSVGLLSSTCSTVELLQHSSKLSHTVTRCSTVVTPPSVTVAVLIALLVARVQLFGKHIWRGETLAAVVEGTLHLGGGHSDWAGLLLVARA